MIITATQIAEGSMIPRWFGIAYFDYERAVAVCYPVGIHLLVMFWHWVEYKDVQARTWSAMRAPMSEAYEAGRRDALKYAKRMEDDRIDKLARSIILEIVEGKRKTL